MLFTQVLKSETIKNLSGDSLHSALVTILTNGNSHFLMLIISKSGTQNEKKSGDVLSDWDSQYHAYEKKIVVELGNN